MIPAPKGRVLREGEQGRVRPGWDAGLPRNEREARSFPGWVRAGGCPSYRAITLLPRVEAISNQISVACSYTGPVSAWHTAPASMSLWGLRECLEPSQEEHCPEE